VSHERVEVAVTVEVGERRKGVAPTSGRSAHSTRSHPEPFVAYAIVRPSGRPM
jgi:hypothetical protein